MGLFQRLQDVVNESTTLLLDSNTRAREALKKINRNPPTYTANNLVEDVTQTALGSLKLWLKFWKPLSDPVLPTVTITAPANTIAGNAGLMGTVSLTDSVPVGVSPDVTSLVFTGWTVLPAPGTDASQIPPLAMKTPIPDAEMDPLRQQLTVTLNVPAAAPVPQRGIYQGFVLLGQAPLAVVVVRAL
jgi:hypothetical protein